MAAAQETNPYGRWTAASAQLPRVPERREQGRCFGSLARTQGVREPFREVRDERGLDNWVWETCVCIYRPDYHGGDCGDAAGG